MNCFTNPIRQNRGYCKTLARLLNIDDSCLFNIVCIPCNAKLKIKHDAEVVRYSTIVDKIQSYKIYDNLIKNNNIDKNLR